jgi:ubiquinone/menaquinone biosynthesis C-methylase UbiE
MKLRTLAGKLLTACEQRVPFTLHLRDPLIPSKWMFRDPDRVDGSRTPEEFTAIGRDTVGWMIDDQGLQPTHRFLDVGCGIGRMAIPLAGYLQKGKYHGFDIAKWKIAYCRRTVGRKRPDFSFHHADVFNKYYNPKGRMRASEYRYPWDDESFDYVLLTSVFTHMLPVDMEHYLSEIARVMGPGAKCIVSYWLSDTKKGSPWHSVSDVCEISDPEEPEYGVVYLERFVTGLFDKHGLRIEKLIPGSERQKPDSKRNSRQDLIIAIKDARRADSPSL